MGWLLLSLLFSLGIYPDGVSTSSISLATDFLESVETTEFTHHSKNVNDISNNSVNEEQDLLIPINRVDRMDFQEVDLNLEHCNNVSYMSSEVHSVPQMCSFRQPFSTFRSSDQKTILSNSTADLTNSSSQNCIQKFVSDYPSDSSDCHNVLLKGNIGLCDINNRTSTELNSLTHISGSANSYSSLSMEVGLRSEFSLDQLNTGTSSNIYSENSSKVKANNDVSSFYLVFKF